VLARGDGASLVEVELVRGRHHQVRAHFAEIGHPLVGDTLYGGKLTGVRAGHFLHASRVTLPIEASRPSPSPDGATKGEASRPSPSPDGAMKGEASQLVKQLDFRCEPPAEFAATLAQYSIERGEAGLE
jgi:23S rRNA-/tRNA-specific pseudouridylate synthase